MKENNWLKYNRQGDMVEITIRDYSGGKIETLRFRVDDKNKHKHIAKRLRDKYGIQFAPEIDRDISWLKDSSELD